MRRLCLLTAFAVVGCFPPDDGREPPLDRFYFPVGVQLSRGNDRLYVVNSDFDLQFNGGSVFALDAARIRDALPSYCAEDADCGSGLVCDVDPERAGARSVLPAITHWCVRDLDQDPCGALGARPTAERQVEPGLCNALELVEPQGGGGSLIAGAAKLGAFVTDLLYVADPSGDKGRLLMPARGTATLHWADVEDDLQGSGPVLECGQGNGVECSSDYARSDSQDADFPVEPFAVAASSDGRVIVTTHQTEGALSLFENDWEGGPSGGPRLEYVLSGLPRQPVGIAAVPVPLLVEGLAQTEYRQGFLGVFGASSSVVQLFRYHDARDANRNVSAGDPPFGAFLEQVRSSSLNVTGTAVARGIVVDAAVRQECESACAQAADCLQACTSVPLEVHLASRFPDALLSGATSPIHDEFGTDDVPNLTLVESLRGGPSRVVMGRVIDGSGEMVRRVFVIAFDSRLIYVYDPVSRSIEARIQTGRGPHALVVDAQHGLGYVAHFTDSYLSVVDLDRRHESYGQIVLSVGRASAPRTGR